MSIILSGLKTIGLFSGAYIGYKHGFIYKNNLSSNDFFKKYDDLYINPNFNANTMPETTFYNCIGLFSGILVGYYAYPIIIPMMLYQLYDMDPKSIFEHFIHNIKQNR